MKLSNSQLYKLVTDVIGIVTSRERLRQLWGVSFYSNAAYLMVASVVTSLLNFAFWIVVARLYATEDVGLASATIAAMGLLAAFAHLGMGIALIRFLPQSGKEANSLVNTAFTIGTLASIAAALIFIAGLGFWSPALLFIRHNPIYLAAFIVFTIASVIASLTGETFVARRQAGYVTAQNLILAVTRLPLPIFLAGIFHSFGIFSSWGISLVVSLLVSFFVFLPRAQPGYRPFFAINRKLVGEIGRFSLANYLGSILWGLPPMVIPIIVLNLLGAEPAAYFYIVWAIANAFTIISGALALSLFAEGSYEESKLGENIRRSLKISFLLFVPVVILLVALADKILLIFGGAYSEHGAVLLRILAPGLIPVGITSIYLSVKRVEKKLKTILGLTAFVAAVTLGLTYLLIPGMGINGVGVAWVAAQGTAALGIMVTWLKGGYVFGGTKVPVSEAKES